MDNRKFAMNYGAILGLVLVLIALTLWILGFDDKQSIIPSLINNFVIIGFLVYSITYYRDRLNNGLISYSECLKLGTTVAFFSSLIVSFYTVIYISYLDTNMLTNALKVTEQAVLQQNPEISEEELDTALEFTAKIMQPHWVMIMGVLSGTFMGFFYSLIISIFTKRNTEN